MKEIYIPYAVYEDKDGFKEAKVHKTFNLEDIKNNDGILNTHYDEKIRILAVNGNLSEKGNVITFKNGIVEEITPEKVFENVTNNFTKLIYEGMNANYMDYKKEDNDCSLNDDISKTLSYFGYKVDSTIKKEFDRENYLKIAEELSFWLKVSLPLNMTDENNIIKKIKIYSKELNTIIAVNHEFDFDIENAKPTLFNIVGDDQDFYFKYSTSNVRDTSLFSDYKKMKDKLKTKNKPH